MPIDPNELPEDAPALRKRVVDLAEQLDRAFAEQHKYQSRLRELWEAQRNRKSERLSKEQLALFETAWQARKAEAESAADEDDDIDEEPPSSQVTGGAQSQKRSRGQALAQHLVRERVVHDLAYSRFGRRDSGCLPEVRLPVHGEDGD